jgi:hypothetical protein
MKTAKPFDSTAEVLDLYADIIKARCQGVDAAHDLASARSRESDPPRPGQPILRDVKCRSIEATQEEQRLRRDLKARLAAHRADANRPKLGIDKVAEEFGLRSEEERIVTVAVALPGIGKLEDSFGNIGSYFGALSIADICTICGATRVSDWLRLRRFLRALLSKPGLFIVGSHHGEPGPDSFMSREIRVSMPAFATLIDDAEAARELAASAPADDGTDE